MLSNDEIQSYLEEQKNIKRFLIVEPILLVQIVGRSIYVFDDVNMFVKCHKISTITGRLENWHRSNPKYFATATFQPNEFGWILAISFAKMLNEIRLNDHGQLPKKASGKREPTNRTYQE